MWRDRRFLDLVGIEHPIVLAPMAGFVSPALTVAVSAAGGLAPLSANANASCQFAAFWSGQAARLARAIPAEELTQMLARETLARLSSAE